VDFAMDSAMCPAARETSAVKARAEHRPKFSSGHQRLPRRRRGPLFIGREFRDTSSSAPSQRSLTRFAVTTAELTLATGRQRAEHKRSADARL
jgi:hypothetical protein